MCLAFISLRKVCIKAKIYLACVQPHGLVVMSPSANLFRWVMPFWIHALAFGLYDSILLPPGNNRITLKVKGIRQDPDWKMCQFLSSQAFIILYNSQSRYLKLNAWFPRNPNRLLNRAFTLLVSVEAIYQKWNTQPIYFHTPTYFTHLWGDNWFKWFNMCLQMTING